MEADARANFEANICSKIACKNGILMVRVDIDHTALCFLSFIDAYTTQGANNDNRRVGGEELDLLFIALRFMLALIVIGAMCLQGKSSIQSRLG